jgi:hypothetical protein
LETPMMKAAMRRSAHPERAMSGICGSWGENKAGQGTRSWVGVHLDWDRRSA